jgi:hypothetical protein
MNGSAQLAQMPPEKKHQLYKQTPSTRVLTQSPQLPRVSGEAWPAVWFALAKHPWHSLVIVPANSSLSSLITARHLADAAKMFEERPSVLIEAESVAPASVRDVIASIHDHVAAGARVLIAVGSPIIDYSAIPIARATDTAVLLVRLTETRGEEANRTIDAVGRSHFLGSITSSPR